MAESAGIIVLASHNQDLIKKTCNRVLELEKGKALGRAQVSEWI
jgi:ABC-type polysaccharide/polyol phosphate transport system ATPase subunit